ncbi:hypothetical protein MPAR168_16905 [Methylorubrum populi]|uniref:Uncharacterized protein n=1 Tax=Methylobacterium radiotolerans TaxID=31998 RepID=A0ABU7TCI8_9HYPH
MPFAAKTLVPALLVLVLLDGRAVFAADIDLARPARTVCLEDARCRRPPGPPDRDIRPLIDPLGRPCGYRWRETPSGPRRVRVCF